jgi:hypothetical protein
MLPASYFETLMSEQSPAPKPDRFADWKRETHFNNFEATLFPPQPQPQLGNDYPLPESAGKGWERLDYSALELRIAKNAVAMGVDWASDVSRSRTVSYVGQGDKAPNCRCAVDLCAEGSLMCQYNPQATKRYEMSIKPSPRKGMFEIGITEQGNNWRCLSKEVSVEDLSKEVSRLLELTSNLTSFVW